MKTALTIAGSDSGGGAGVQADLKSFSANGVFGMSVITAVTAQNTVEVRSVQNIEPKIIKDQIEAVFDDLPVDAVKIGMLSTEETIDVVSTTLRKYNPGYLVVDPVMVSKGGQRLLEEKAVSALIKKILPLATMITPNIPEAEVILDESIKNETDMKTACRFIHSLGSKSVLLKGGHLEGDPNDLFFDGEHFYWIKGKRVFTKNTHGTGCTLSAALAANLAKGASLLDAVQQAKEYINSAIEHSLDLGHGHGPTNHFYDLYQKAGLMYS